MPTVEPFNFDKYNFKYSKTKPTAKKECIVIDDDEHQDSASDIIRDDLDRGFLYIMKD